MAFKTTKILENEIAKQVDFQYANRSGIENLSSFIRYVFKTPNSVVMGGKVLQASPVSMNVLIDPLLAFSSTVIAFSDSISGPFAIEASNTQDRIDIVQVKGEYVGFDTQQRAFNDPATMTKTYSDVDTKEKIENVILIKKGVPGSDAAPSVDAGYIKLAEVKVRANTTSILTADIINITSDLPGSENNTWTTDKSSSFGMLNITEFKMLFRVGHTNNGTHATESIKASNIKFSISDDGVTTGLLPLNTIISAAGMADIAENTILTTILQTLATIKENKDSKDASGGYVGLTLFKMNFKNALNTITSFFTNANTAARTYTFRDRDGTIADDTDLSELYNIVRETYQKTVTVSAPYTRFTFSGLGIPDAVYSAFSQLKGVNTKFVHQVSLVCSGTYVDVYIYFNADGVIGDGTPVVKWGSKKFGAFKFGQSESIEIDLFFRKEA